LLYYAVVTRETNLFQNYVSLGRRTSEIVFISARENLPDITSKLLLKLIAAREYVPTRSWSLK